MDNTSSRINESDDWSKYEAICQAGATRWAFPPLLASSYYPEVFDSEYNRISNDVDTLPGLLRDQGYSTGAFLGSNPNLNMWEPYFDEYHNVDLGNRDQGVDGQLGEFKKTARMAKNFLLLRDHVTASDIKREAEDWYENTSGPKFLWLHLMEPHAPYYPGFKEGLKEGLLRSYKSLYRYSKHLMDAPESDLARIRNLYERCLNLLDRKLKEIFDFLPDDSVVVVVADHGEEFDHGLIGHSRIYEESTRVPLLTKNIEFESSNPRHLDIPATILDTVGSDIPSSWRGEVGGKSDDEAFILHPSPERLGQTFAGYRTGEKKYIMTYSDDGEELISTEAYDLTQDPDESVNLLSDQQTLEEYQTKIFSFLDDFDDEMIWHQGLNPESKEVEERLADLGYL